MAKILKFEPSAHQQDRQRDDTAGSAEIVIFPGVRVERCEFKLSDRLDAPENATKDRRRRSKLTRK